MSTFVTVVLIPIILGFLVSEATEIAPWCARRLIIWSAKRRYKDPALQLERIEEWTALLDERPGKLLKVATAVPFAVSALTRPADSSFDRPRVVPIALIAVSLALATTGTGVAAYNAEPGDAMWPLTRTLFPEHASITQKIASVREAIEEANLSLSRGDRESARRALDASATELAQVPLEQGRSLGQRRDDVAGSLAPVPQQETNARQPPR